MSSHTEMQIGTHIFRIINQHMDEAEGCRHNIMEIMKEAFQTENNGGIRPTTGEHQVSTSTSTNTNQGNDIDSEYYTSE
jgi:hypothetical protein